MESSWLLIPYRTDRGQDLIAGLAEGFIHTPLGRGVNGACRGTSFVGEHEHPAHKTSPNDPWGPVG